MKNYEKIYQDITNNKTELSKLEKLINTVDLCLKKERSDYREYCKSGAILDTDIAIFDENIENYKKELSILYDNEHAIKAKNNMLRHNMIISAFYEITPVFCEIWNSYAGKRLGEKTNEKIRNELKEKTNFGFYVSSNYCSDFVFFSIEPQYHFLKYDCGAQPALIDNVIQELTPEDITIQYIRKDYIEDIDKEYKELVELHDKIKNLSEELYSMVSKFNSLAVSQNRSIEYPKSVYSLDMYI